MPRHFLLFSKGATDLERFVGARTTAAAATLARFMFRTSPRMMIYIVARRFFCAWRLPVMIQRCQDLWAAYRQFLLEWPNDAFILLLTPSGPSLWRHGVLPFGAASSVWCFNRCVDALTFLARSHLLILLIHFVDDIGCPDSKASSASSFQSFRDLCNLLGMCLKPSKAQPPATKHKLLGVALEICAAGITLAPAAIGSIKCKR